MRIIIIIIITIIVIINIMTISSDTIVKLLWGGAARPASCRCHRGSRAAYSCGRRGVAMAVKTSTMTGHPHR
jgi:hypothetical protein